MSLVYNLIILIVCWIFYTVMTNAGVERKAQTESEPAVETKPAAALKPVPALTPKEGVA